MLGRQTLLNCAPFHKMSQGCDGGRALLGRGARAACGVGGLWSWGCDRGLTRARAPHRRDALTCAPRAGQPTTARPAFPCPQKGGDAIDVLHYMAKFGLPDESCLHYAASDWTAFKEHGMERCPPEKFCVK
jgi:hypothetical protein